MRRMSYLWSLILVSLSLSFFFLLLSSSPRSQRRSVSRTDLLASEELHDDQRQRHAC